MEVPEEKQHIDDIFADPDNFEMQAQILVGADKATLFPFDERDNNRSPVQTNKCQLM